MHNRYLQSWLTALLVLPLAADAPAMEGPAQMEQVIQHYASRQQFMGTALVAKDGQVLLSKGYGSVPPRAYSSPSLPPTALIGSA